MFVFSAMYLYSSTKKIYFYVIHVVVSQSLSSYDTISNECVQFIRKEIKLKKDYKLTHIFRKIFKNQSVVINDETKI